MDQSSSALVAGGQGGIVQRGRGVVGSQGGEPQPLEAVAMAQDVNQAPGAQMAARFLCIVRPSLVSWFGSSQACSWPVATIRWV